MWTIVLCCDVINYFINLWFQDTRKWQKVLADADKDDAPVAVPDDNDSITGSGKSKSKSGKSKSKDHTTAGE